MNLSIIQKWIIGASITISLVILFIVLISISISDVRPTEIALVYDTYQKEFRDGVYVEGRYVIGPTSVFKRFENTYQIIDFALENNPLVCVSRDGMDISIDVVSQYKIGRKKLLEMLYLYDDLLDNILKNKAASDFSNVCAMFEVETGFIQNRSEVSFTMRDIFDDDLHESGLDITSGFAEIRNYEYSKEYQEAVTNKQLALQQIELLLSERPVLLENAEAQLVKATQQSLIDIQKARIIADGRIESSKNIADAIYKQWVEYANAYENVYNHLNMSASDFIKSYLSVIPIADPNNNNQLFVKLD